MGIEKKRGKMSGTVNYPKVIDQLADVIKELNVPCGAAAPSEETRRADAVGLLKALLSTLEQGPAAAAAAAEHDATDDKFTYSTATRQLACNNLISGLKASGWSRGDALAAAVNGGYSYAEASRATVLAYGVIRNTENSAKSNEG
jgi:hypothetical protein